MLTKIARRIRGFRKDERGVSGLLEVTAVLLLMGLVLGTLYSSMYSSQNTVLDTSERLRNLDEARTLIATITKDIRTAVRTEAGTSPFLKADKEEVVFYANLETTAAPKLVRIFIDSQDRLYEQVWTYDTATTVVPKYRYGGAAYPRSRRPASRPSAWCASWATSSRTLRRSRCSPTKRTLESRSRHRCRGRMRACSRSRRSRSSSGSSGTRSVNVNTTVIQNKVRLPNLEYNTVAG